MLGIDDEDAQVQAAFLQKSGFSFAALVEPKKQASNLYSIGGIPTTVSIDQLGTIKAYDQGTASYESLRETLLGMGVHWDLQPGNLRTSGSEFDRRAD